MCNCCKNASTLAPVPGCLDTLGAQCVTYTSDLSVAQALTKTELVNFIPALIVFLSANPTLKNQLKLALQ